MRRVSSDWQFISGFLILTDATRKKTAMSSGKFWPGAAREEIEQTHVD
jgi:hypothetical protein